MSQDNAEFAQFFAASWDPCVRAVAASTGNMTLAEDQTAEAFAPAWASWHKVSHHAAPRAWVVRTALKGALTLELTKGTPVNGTPVPKPSPAAETVAPADIVTVINPAAIPSGTELFLGYFNSDHVLASHLIDTSSYTCSTGQPPPATP